MGNVQQISTAPLTPPATIALPACFGLSTGAIATANRTRARTFDF